MGAPKAVSNDKEEPASGTWEVGMAEHLEDMGDSEPEGDEQDKEERTIISEGPVERLDKSWLTMERKKCSCSQEAWKAGQKQRVEKGHHYN